jgi:hypothetical protein
MEKAPAPPAAERTNVPNELPDHTNRSNDLEAIVAIPGSFPYFVREALFRLGIPKREGRFRLKRKTRKAGFNLLVEFPHYDNSGAAKRFTKPIKTHLTILEISNREDYERFQVSCLAAVDAFLAAMAAAAAGWHPAAT